MGTIWEYALVFLLAATPWFEIAAVIPLGILRGLQPVLVVILAFLGNLSTIVLLIYLFDKVKDFLKKRKGKEGKGAKREERARRIWNKYGLPGLVLLGPILIGIHIAVFLGLTLGATKRWALLWSIVSLILWSAVFGIGAFYGIGVFKTYL